MFFSRAKRQAILFADVSGSSALYRTLGNKKAKSIIDSILEILIYQTKKYEGRVIKTIGDEAMSCFVEAEKAAKAAIEMQQQVDQKYHKDGIGIKIGVGYGRTIQEKKDIFGAAVNDAAYVAGIAKQGQILLAEAARETLSESLRILTEKYDSVQIKGASEHSTIYRLYWKQTTSGFSETKVFNVESLHEDETEASLTLHYLDKEYQVTKTNKPFLIGRQSHVVDLYVDSGLVSRDHCHIVYRRGKFVLIDGSTNGTYIQPDDGQEIYLRREELPLIGSGIISFGVSGTSPEAHSVRFTCPQ